MPPKRKAIRAAPRRRKKSSLPWALMVIAGLILTLFVVLAVTRQPSPVKRSEAPPGVIALLDGLEHGYAIGAWQVHELRVIDAQLGIDFLSGPQIVTVWVARKGTQEKAPPRETERYALYYGFPPESQEAVSRDIDAILGDIEARVRRTEARVPTPPGM
jgi:hypothetical protein